MPLRFSVKTEIPKDTARMAKAVFGPNNVYIKAGDRLPQVLQEGQALTGGTTPAETDRSILPVFSLVTVFQFLEGLSDDQAIEAIQTRVDWKYALHLPYNCPGVQINCLCEERQKILHDPAYQTGFQFLLDCLEVMGFYGFGVPLAYQAVRVVDTVCTLSRMEFVVKAMNLAIETLAADYPDWFRQVAMPGWYARYAPGGIKWRLPVSKTDQEVLTLSVGKDSRQLVEALFALNSEQLNSLVEIRSLNHIWRQQFNLGQDDAVQYLAHCSYCGVQYQSQEDS